MFRFAIRDLLWLTVVVALGVGWWKEHQRAEHATALAIQKSQLEQINAAAIAAWRRDLRQMTRGPLEVDE
jgi:hypothetical protein